MKTFYKVFYYKNIELLAKAKAMLAGGYSYEEIAKACGVPKSTIYDTLNK